MNTKKAAEDKGALGECKREIEGRCNTAAMYLRMSGMPTLAEALERNNQALEIVLAFAMDMENGTARVDNPITARRIATELRAALAIAKHLPT